MVVLFLWISRVSPRKNFHFNIWLFVVKENITIIAKLSHHKFPHLVQNRKNICTWNIWCIQYTRLEYGRNKAYVHIWTDAQLNAKMPSKVKAYTAAYCCTGLNFFCHHLKRVLTSLESSFASSLAFLMRLTIQRSASSGFMFSFLRKHAVFTQRKNMWKFHI